jgi:hypothetical protein
LSDSGNLRYAQDDQQASIIFIGIRHQSANQQDIPPDMRGVSPFTSAIASIKAEDTYHILQLHMPGLTSRREMNLHLYSGHEEHF